MSIGLSDVDRNTGAAALTISTKKWSSRSVGINLRTGELSTFKRRRGAPSADENTLPSPSGRLIAHDKTSEGGGLIIKTAKGRKVAEVGVRHLNHALNVAWAPDESGLTYEVFDEYGEKRSGLYFYSLKTRASRLLVQSRVVQTKWSPNRRFVAFTQVRTAAKGMPESIRNRTGTLVILDGKASFKKVFTVGKLVKECWFSPDGGRIAFIELTKDEYGDYDNTALRVLDLRTGKSLDLATNRREFQVLWAGEGLLAMVAHDKYAVPSLALVSAVSGNRRVLAVHREFGYITPLAFLPDPQRVVYTAADRSPYEGPVELWAAEPGRKPARLFPKKVSR
jgi:Tol biopolymer transport system component